MVSYIRCSDGIVVLSSSSKRYQKRQSCYSNRENWTKEREGDILKLCLLANCIRLLANCIRLIANWIRRFSEINPTRCTILFNIFIYFSSLHVSGIHVPIISRKLLYLYDTGVCHSVWVATGLLVGLQIQPADQTLPIQSDKYKCRTDTAIFSWWWTHGCPKHVEKRNK